MKKALPMFLVCLTSLFILNSYFIRGDFKGLYSYYERTKKENPGLLIKSDNNIHHLKYSKNVYVINGQCLKNSLQESESLTTKQLLYF